MVLRAVRHQQMPGKTDPLQACLRYQFIVGQREFLPPEHISDKEAAAGVADQLISPHPRSHQPCIQIALINKQAEVIAYQMRKNIDPLGELRFDPPCITNHLAALGHASAVEKYAHDFFAPFISVYSSCVPRTDICLCCQLYTIFMKKEGMICCKCMDRLHLSMHLLFLSPSRFQHILNKDAIARRRLIGDGADELAVLQNGTAGHE